MSVLQPRYSKEEFARRGQEIYERDIQPRLKPDDKGQFVAIDIETGKYEMDSDDYTAVERLLSQVPDAQSWLVRVGEQAAYRTGRGPVRREAQ
ncbi:MAG: hypothetical protein WD894_05300 [Pirellulales bacterium]